MLMRDEDAPIFEQTKRWLADDDNAVFHLIVDELHLYRGTAGSEVAYLLRVLLHRLGLSPDDLSALQPRYPKAEPLKPGFLRT